MELDYKKTIALGKEVLEIESKAIKELGNTINSAFVNACEKILACSGRIIVTGMGKSGHIGRKVAATLASTGTPAFFLHPGEASHGDLGMVTTEDVVLAISNTGETKELLFILPLIKRLNVFLVSMTGNPNSNMATLSDLHLSVNVSQEACSLGLAPTASTTAALAFGDAIAISVLSARGFSKEDFARTHPGGSLGKRLCLKVEDLMHKGDQIPAIHEDDNISNALVEMTQKRLGMTTVIAKAKNHSLVGVFTDGDLRRTLEKNINLNNTRISNVMTKNFKTITHSTLAYKALYLMETHEITALPVVNTENQLIGALNIQDLLKADVL